MQRSRAVRRSGLTLSGRAMAGFALALLALVLSLGAPFASADSPKSKPLSPPDTPSSVSVTRAPTAP